MHCISQCNHVFEFDLGTLDTLHKQFPLWNLKGRSVIA